MRIGKWVPLYHRVLPLPRRLSMSFGLHEGSQLHLVPLRSLDSQQMHGCEVMASPIPFESWRSVCRLSVRLKDNSQSLAVAAEFLRRERINVLLSECCSTYQDRAHWDAICDLAFAPAFSNLADSERADYEADMQQVLSGLTTKFERYAAKGENRTAFLEAAHAVQFSPLTGLNDASFIGRPERRERVSYHAGAIELPEKLAATIARLCGAPPALPQYAMLTGNTEQRYVRVLFLKDHRRIFRAVIDDALEHFAAGGVGVLHQVLKALPPEINLMRAANHVTERGDDYGRGRIDLIGHWISDRDEIDGDVDYKKRELQQRIEGLALEDVDGRIHHGALKLVKFATARTVYPRVFVSYSTAYNSRELQMLISTLAQNNYEPVLGTEVGGIRRDINGRVVSSDVSDAAFRAIDSCVAFISLQVKREDFAVVHDENGRRYVLSPWTVAEEVYAWSSGTAPLIIRLRDAQVEDPRYNRNALTALFDASEESSFEVALGQVMNELNKLRLHENFQRFMDDARRAQFREQFSPTDV